jgi:hypothetical protein
MRELAVLPMRVRGIPSLLSLAAVVGFLLLEVAMGMLGS